MTTIDLTPLQLRVARDIVSYARRENLKAGQRMVESLLAEQVGTSRSPVNAALCYLGGLGVHASLGAVVSKAIDCYYGVLVKEGAVPPNL